MPEVRIGRCYAPHVDYQHRVASERRRLGPRRPQLGLTPALEEMPWSSNKMLNVIRMAASVVAWFTLDNRSDFGPSGQG